MAAPNEEWFDIVDEKGTVIGKAPRSYIHQNPKLIHPVVHVHVFNQKGHLFLQKRIETKDLFPGYWDTAVGGHISAGETVGHALLRESQEELGINASAAKPIFRHVLSNKFESELLNTFILKNNGPFVLAADEISEGRFWTMFEIMKNLGQNVFTPNFEVEFKMLEKAGFL